MKTFILKYCSCAMLSLLLFALKSTAQPPQPARPEPPANSRVSRGPDGSLYTYTLFIAPNKVYGYNIFQNGKIIYHQPAMPQSAGNKQPTLTEKMQADKAAFIAIEKIKSGQPAELTTAELLQATTH
ncbi:MAG: hypothetical protein JWR61_1330 [Ferruginibacter sp.]|uniref:DUF4907 domain-containing protein n=1 Tax=Ferruginibacter sp. TaxID=1940288 RepID=UPI002657BBE8|nr:DUF4907 domain-containing protein [Ferruginibacter sp.]MDB5276375.1 hypothetical protein [Ferruginibacter sp.]